MTPPEDAPDRTASAQSPAAAAVAATAAEVAWRGIDHCRRGEWMEGLSHLGRLAVGDESDEVPALAWSYLGYGLARQQGRLREGERLCERAVELEPYQPETHLLMARLHLLTDDRRAAVEAAVAGLATDPSHAGLLALAEELGERRRPVMPFLSRDHPINRALGRLRHGLLRRRIRRA
ncbi:MAG: hypothetical protein AAGN46_07120 [Acidobacteriota bacterium]